MVEPDWLAPVSGADGLEGIWLAHCSQLPPSQHLRRNGTLRFERCARGIFSAQLLEFARLDQASVGSAETEQMDGTKRWGSVDGQVEGSQKPPSDVESGDSFFWGSLACKIVQTT